MKKTISYNTTTLKCAHDVTELGLSREESRVLECAVYAPESAKTDKDTLKKYVVSNINMLADILPLVNFTRVDAATIDRVFAFIELV